MDPETMKLLLGMMEHLARIAEQTGRYQMLLAVTFVLTLLMLVKEGIYFGRYLKRVMGLTQKTADPTDLATVGHIQQLVAAHERASMERTRTFETDIANSVNAHFMALKEEISQQKKKANATLIILRDLRTFMIYNRKPTSDEQTAIINDAIDES